MSQPTPIRLAISTCPNDTFAFHGLIQREVDWRGLEFETRLLDIEQLNEGWLRGDFDVAKASFSLALSLTDSTVVLPVGSALGFGVGPLLLGREPGVRPKSAQQIVLCPGQHTTATLLFRLFHPQSATEKHVVFSEIIPGLERGQADFGICIHEGRFTYAQHGLQLVEDLGIRWESETACPLPLGGLLATRSLPEEMRRTVIAVILDSLQLALSRPEAALPTMREHAQEFDDDVLMKHVELYVNDWTVDLGPDGRMALESLQRQARAANVTEMGDAPIEVAGGE